MATIIGFENSENVLIGTPKDDSIDGLSGNDQLYGYFNSDTLVGGSGNDLLAGQYDTDGVTGGAGVDQFNFSSHCRKRHMPHSG